MKVEKAGNIYLCKSKWTMKVFNVPIVGRPTENELLVIHRQYIGLNVPQSKTQKTMSQQHSKSPNMNIWACIKETGHENSKEPN